MFIYYTLFRRLFVCQKRPSDCWPDHRETSLTNEKNQEHIHYSDKIMAYALAQDVPAFQKHLQSFIASVPTSSDASLRQLVQQIKANNITDLNDDCSC